MSRHFHPLTISVLAYLKEHGQTTFKELYQKLRPEQLHYKEFYNMLYRLQSGQFINKIESSGGLKAELNETGEHLLRILKPQKDGVWKMVVFDIPEKHKYVRTVLRAKLKSLGFKKWQNSIWASPYELDSEIEEELNQLAKKYFVRVIKASDINYTEDLEKLFKIRG